MIRWSGHLLCIRISASSKRHSEVQTVTVERASTDGSIVEVLDHVLDNGIVINAWVRVALVSIGRRHGPRARGRRLHPAGPRRQRVYATNQRWAS